MSSKVIIALFLLLNISHISSRFFICPETSEPPQTVDNPNFSFEPVIYDGVPLNPVVISDQVLINNHHRYVESIKTLYTDSLYCPENYTIMKKEELESIISYLGDNAYTTFLDENSLDMSEGIYYVTNTKGNGDYNKIFMILKDNQIKFEDFDPMSYIMDFTSNQKFHTICKLTIPKVEIVFPDNNKDFDYNTKIKIKVNYNQFFIAYLWKINDKLYTEEEVNLSLNESGVNNIEFWGKYVTGKMEYLCDIFFVSEEKVPDGQDYNTSNIKKITTQFKMFYNNALHFTTSNCPVAPRDDGGYYIAVANTELYLHILSFDKEDNLIKDFDTKEKARPHDITATYLGFAVYVMDADNRNHAYITVYNKDFEMVNRVQVMNNSMDGVLVDSTPDKQLIRHNSNGKAQLYIRFIYQADNAKLVYSRGRIFLIFSHYNYFNDDNSRHNADAVATFNDELEDLDFGSIWGASHSLIQSATFDDNYFWSAALSDAYPQGIKVQYTSKRNFTNDYDGYFKKYNLRVNGANSDLAGIIKGYTIGWADGKLGGILYFDKLELYCLVYAKTPNYSDDNKNNKTIIYITTWKFVNNEIKDTKVKEIKIFETGNVMQVRAGKLGYDKVFITYTETNTLGHNYYGSVAKGSIPKIFVVQLPQFEIIINDEINNDLLMNTNEDLRTFKNGVLIWATADSNNNLVINKIGDKKKDEENELAQESNGNNNNISICLLFLLIIFVV